MPTEYALGVRAGISHQLPRIRQNAGYVRPTSMQATPGRVRVVVNLKSHPMLTSEHAVMVPVLVPAPSTLRMKFFPKLPKGFMRFGRREVFTVWAKKVQVNGEPLTMQRIWVPVWDAIITEAVSESAGVALRVNFINQPRNQIGK